MKVIGLLSWYEEDPAWLTECVTSAAKLCDHLIAVDGPYALYPSSHLKPRSSTDQYAAIMSAAAGSGMGLTIHYRQDAWRGGRFGGEVDKRDFMFRVGMQIADPFRDWFFRIDADETLTQVPHDTKSRLEVTCDDVAEVAMWERGDGDLPDSTYNFRCLYRAVPGISVRAAHYVVVTPPRSPVFDKWRYLTGDDKIHPLEPAEQLLDVKLEHRTSRRGIERKRLKQVYANSMKSLGVEKLTPPCARCLFPYTNPETLEEHGTAWCDTCLDLVTSGG